MFESIDQLPEQVRATYTPNEQAEYLRVYNTVFQQTQDATKASAAATGAITKMRVTGVKALRSAPNGDIIAGGWSMKFSNPTDKDSYDTFFGLASKLMLEYYPNAPLWMEHGMDNDYGIDPIGMRSAVQIYGFGVWMEHTVYANHPLFDETKQGLEDGEFSYSSDSIGHYVDKGFNEVNGRMDVWPFAGCSLTRSPAEISLGPVSLRSFNPKLQAFILNKPSDLEAREARETKRTLIPFRNSSQGEMIMDPAKLAALAEWLGCDATPQAVLAALQQLMTQLQQQPAGDAGATPDPAAVQAQEAMMSQLRAGFGLPDTAKAEDIVAKMNDIKALLGQPARSKLSMKGLKNFMGLVQADLDETPEDDDIPFYGPDSDDDGDEDDAPVTRRSASSNGNGRSAQSGRFSFAINKKSKKPGLMDVVAAITQVKNGDVQFDMPNFKSQRTSARAALKAMNVNNAASGGWLLNREMVAELLNALYAELVFEKLGVKIVPMDGIESVTMNRVQSGASAYWAGQGQTVTDANAKIQAAVTLQLKELVAKSILENKFLKNSSSAEQIVEDDIRRVMKLKIELAGLYGTGSVPLASGNSGAEPLGLSNTTGITNTSLASKAPTISDLIDAEGRIEDTNLEYTDLSWLSSKRARRYFKKVKDANGNPVFEEDWVSNDVRRALIVQDHAFETTTQVPNTTAGSVITTDIFLGDWNSMLMGQGLDLEMVVDTSRYVEERSTLIQIVSYVDFGVAYKEAFQILSLAKVN